MPVEFEPEFEQPDHDDDDELFEDDEEDIV